MASRYGTSLRRAMQESIKTLQEAQLREMELEKQKKSSEESASTHSQAESAPEPAEQAEGPGLSAGIKRKDGPDDEADHDGSRKRSKLPNPWKPASETTRRSMSRSSVERAFANSISRGHDQEEQQEEATEDVPIPDAPETEQVRAARDSNVPTDDAVVGAQVPGSPASSLTDAPENLDTPTSQGHETVTRPHRRLDYSCRECRKKRVHCDKHFPCHGCQKRGECCTPHQNDTSQDGASNFITPDKPSPLQLPTPESLPAPKERPETSPSLTRRSGRDRKAVLRFGLTKLPSEADLEEHESNLSFHDKSFEAEEEQHTPIPRTKRTAAVKPAEHLEPISTNVKKPTTTSKIPASKVIKTTKIVSAEGSPRRKKLPEVKAPKRRSATKSLVSPVTSKTPIPPLGLPSSRDSQNDTGEAWFLPEIDPDMTALSERMTSRLPLAEKPKAAGEPLVWADSRQALCETVPYFKKPQGGCHSNDKHVYAFLFDGVGHCREYMDSDVVIARAGGGMECNASGQMVQSKHQSMQDSQVQAVKNDIALQNPFIIICGDKNTGALAKMPHKYCVLGWFKPVDVWSEKTVGKAGKAWITVKYRLERLSTEPNQAPWFAPDQQHSLPNEDKAGQLKLETCRDCEQRWPQVYLCGWMCLNAECQRFWQLGGRDAPYGALAYDPAFLLYRHRWADETEPYSVVPRLPDVGKVLGDHIRYINTRGTCCPKCGRCNSRYLFSHWRCDNPKCDWILRHQHNPIEPAALHSPWDNYGDGPALARNKHDDSVNVNVEYVHGYKVYTYTFDGIKGSFVHAVANSRINREPMGPNHMLKELQTTDMGLERRRFGGEKISGGKDEATTNMGSKVTSAVDTSLPSATALTAEVLMTPAIATGLAGPTDHEAPAAAAASGDSTSSVQPECTAASTTVQRSAVLAQRDELHDPAVPHQSIATSPPDHSFAAAAMEGGEASLLDKPTTTLSVDEPLASTEGSKSTLAMSLGGTPTPSTTEPTTVPSLPGQEIAVVSFRVYELAAPQKKSIESATLEGPIFAAHGEQSSEASASLSERDDFGTFSVLEESVQLHDETASTNVEGTEASVPPAEAVAPAALENSSAAAQPEHPSAQGQPEQSTSVTQSQGLFTPEVPGDDATATMVQDKSADATSPEDIGAQVENEQSVLQVESRVSGADVGPDATASSAALAESTSLLPTPPSEDIPMPEATEPIAIPGPSSKAETDDGDFMTAFSMNYGMPYKFVAGGATRPFEEAPEAVRACRSRLNWAARTFLQLDSNTDHDFNEELIFAYMEGQKIEYHDDGEEGLGPRIATLSLGGKAKMHMRMKAKHYVGCSKSGVFTPEEPRPGSIGGSEMYQKRLTAWQELQGLKDMDRAAYRKRQIEIPKELGLFEKRTKKADDLVTITLGHGDIVLMDGYEIQKYLEHKVVPADHLRFALTCREVLASHLSEAERPAYEVRPDDYGYDGAKVHDW